MRKPSSLPRLIFVTIFGIGLAVAYSSFGLANYQESVTIVAGSAVIGLIFSYSTKLTNQSKRVVALRVGRFRAL
jgi:hypothetical protein